MLDGMENTIHRELNRIAEAADTSSREGVSYLLTGSFKNCLLNFSRKMQYLMMIMNWCVLILEDREQFYFALKEIIMAE